MIARDGRVVWVQGECQVIRDEDGRPLFLQGIAFDITHLKRSAQIEEAKQSAEAANRAKSEFLARMSHEIRTPLNGVVGMIDLLRATGMTASQQRYAQLAREAADALLNVINDILDFSKIEAGKVEIEAIEFDLPRAVEDLTELLAAVAAKKKLGLNCLIRPEVPRRLIGDPTRLRQILTNLITNAVKFTPRGFISIRTTVETAEGDRTALRIEVEDTGIGIPADRIDRLFKSFSQVDTSTTRKFGGTGLGLAICKQLVELMGGQIGIRSAEGQGTTFWFTLSLKNAATAGEPQPECGSAEALREVRLLGVESDPTDRRILIEQLEGRLSASSAVVDIADALGALRNAAAQGKPFGVAMIPFGTAEAHTLVSLIQSDPTLKQIKLIAITDIDERTDDETVRQGGFITRLHRPLLQSRLMDAIASAILPPQSPHKLQQAAPAPVTLKGLHLLVAEDNEMNQFVTQETLKRVGCTCEIVADGALALEAVQARAFDAVLMDCQMPGMDGLEASRRIRDCEAASGTGKHIPIIALTAEAIAGDRERCLAAGMDGYVSKPINPDDLFAAIQLLTQNRRPVAAPQPPKVTGAAPIDLDALLSPMYAGCGIRDQNARKICPARSAEDVEILRRGIADADATARVAHNLNAVANHVSAGPLGKIAFDIEQASIRREMQYVTEQVARLADEAGRCGSFVPVAIERIAEMAQSPNALQFKR